MPTPQEHQRDVAQILLASVAESEFALAGSGAIREHGLTDRPTEDVDLFASSQRFGLSDAASFKTAVDKGIDALREAGYDVERGGNPGDLYARLMVATPDAYTVEVDFGVDYREHDPVRLDVGAVLARDDAVGNKVAAVFSRKEERDFLDVDSIRTRGDYDDETLLTLAADRDGGFDREMFAHQLAEVQRVQPSEVARYGVDASTLDGIKERLTTWSTQIRANLATEREAIALDQATFPRLGNESVSGQQSETGHRRPRDNDQSVERDGGIER